MTRLMTLEARIMEEPNSGCWLWIGGWNDRGYPDSHGKRMHRVIYERDIGPIPGGMELDHLFRVRSCVNPRHMEPVTHRENVLRGFSPLAMQARQTHCKRGHPLEAPNVYVYKNGRRDCRMCWPIRLQELQAKKETLL